jgi:hypothetical protein
MAVGERIFLLSDAAKGRYRSAKGLGCKTPRRRAAVTPKAPKRSEGAAQPADECFAFASA